MASPPDSEDRPHHEKSVWTEEEELQFMQVLFEQKGDISPGHIFREPVLNDILGQLKVPQKGPKRSIKACASKWKSLKDIYKLVFKLQNKLALTRTQRWVLLCQRITLPGAGHFGSHGRDDAIEGQGHLCSWVQVSGSSVGAHL
ncbi:hypothetical protein BJV74DRAFT_927201 [Russula compacta]|nr:hypothetical protein BJV74DRAFT_927201 [Russula compacta]